MLKVQHIRDYFIQELKSERFVTDKTGVKTIELIGQSFEADEPTIFGELNQDYIDRELAWYKSKSLNVNDIPGKVPARSKSPHSSILELVTDVKDHLK